MHLPDDRVGLQALKLRYFGHDVAAVCKSIRSTAWSRNDWSHNIEKWTANVGASQVTGSDVQYPYVRSGT
jgi:hypothetical protein